MTMTAFEADLTTLLKQAEADREDLSRKLERARMLLSRQMDELDKDAEKAAAAERNGAINALRRMLSDDHSGNQDEVYQSVERRIVAIENGAEL